MPPPFLARSFDLADRLATGLASRWRNVYLKARGVRIDGYCWLRRVDVPRNFANVHLDRCSLDRGVTLLCSGPPGPTPKITVGHGAYLNRNTFLDATESLTIGREVAIGPGCYLTDHDHGTDVSRSPLDQPMVAVPTRVGDRAWLGAHVVVLKGVTIGERTIVGAGSVVTKSLPPDVVAAGVPARVIRSRLPGESTPSPGTPGEGRGEGDFDRRKPLAPKAV